ncbi:purine-nucleoside phosphorylase [Ruegeria hyattellae]|uniref:purine-nucleoside phosphorylase n=1 Tax=Ruegeria hyattellae TaxID=3233337 RepID=UPI00355B6CC2
MDVNVQDTVNLIQNRSGIGKVDVALVLGSGLSSFIDEIEGTSIDYSDLPDFPHAGVSGHAPKLKLATIGGTNIAILGGRMHYYERGEADVMRFPLEVIAGLETTKLILTNAAGSVREAYQPGSLLRISDHLNFSGLNPLIGEETDRRFVALDGAYDAEIGAALDASAAAVGVELPNGVYTWFSGPSFETPAEIRATQVLGGDAVGMSTVPEVILARFLGLRVGAISTITNMGAGMSDENLSHEHTKNMAPIGSAKLAKVLKHYLENYKG